MKEAQRLKLLKQTNVEDVKKKRAREREIRKLKTGIRKGSYGEKLQQAGLAVPATLWIGGVLAMSVLFTITFSNSIGLLVGVTLGASFAYYFLSMYLTVRAEARRRLVVPQLPGFLDTLSASLGTGYNMEISIEHATNSLPDGVLKREFFRVNRLVSRGVTLDESLSYLGRRIAGPEVISMIITIKMFSDLGGRVLTPFKRLGYKMREQQVVLERANRDLVSAKQTFYVIFGLSVLVPGFLSVSQPEYLMNAFKHEMIRYLMQGAIVIQVVCFMAFKRFTTLRV